MVDPIGDAIIATDVAGIIHRLNPVAERMTGWTKAEAVGRPLAKVFVIINEEARMAAIDPVAACIKQGKIVGMADRTMLLSRNGDNTGSKIRRPRSVARTGSVTASCWSRIAPMARGTVTLAPLH
ncbi:MAG: PAS domain-containing protein [Burkholderiaceae bacterium]